MSEELISSLISVAHDRLENAAEQSSRCEFEIGEHRHISYKKDMAVGNILYALEQRGVSCELFYSLKYALTHLLKRAFEPLTDEAMDAVKSFYEADRNPKGYYDSVASDNGVDFMVPGSPVKIGRGCFLGVKYRSIVVPDSVVEIDGYAFMNCSCQSLFLGGALRSIGESAFRRCIWLSGIEIPRSVGSIGKDAFLLTGMQKTGDAVAVFHRAKGDVAAMEAYPWGLRKGQIIRCSDGDLIVGSE